MKRLFLLIILVTLGMASSCQLASKKSPSTISEPTYKMQTKLQLTNQDGKKTTAKGFWYVANTENLRLDIIGPFDLLLGQIFITPKMTTVIDHREKIARQVPSHKSIEVHGVAIRPADLLYLIQRKAPVPLSSWKCQTDQYTFACRNNELLAHWDNEVDFFLETSDKKLLVHILNKEWLESSADWFAPKYPDSYNKP